MPDSTNFRDGVNFNWWLQQTSSRGRWISGELVGIVGMMGVDRLVDGLAGLNRVQGGVGGTTPGSLPFETQENCPKAS